MQTIRLAVKKALTNRGPEDVTKALIQLDKTSLRIVEILDHIRQLKGLEDKKIKIDLQSYNVYDLVHSVVENFDYKIKEKNINIEIKNTKATQAVLELTTSYINTKNWQPSDFLLSSFHWNELEEIANTQSLIPIGIISENPLNVTLAFAKKIKAHSIHPFFELIDKEDVSLMQAEGFKVYPWTVNAPKAIMLMHAYGVDGIISDFPDRI